MLTKERRPFTEAERERVRVMLAATYQRQGLLSRAAGVFFGLAGGLLLGGFLAFLLLMAWTWLAGLLHRGALPYTASGLLLDAGGGGGVALAAWMMYQGSRNAATRLAEGRQKFQQDLDGDEAEVWHCEAPRVVQLGEDGGDGPSFFAEVGPGQLLFLELERWHDVPGDVAEVGDGVDGPLQSEAPGGLTVWPPPPRPGRAFEFPCRRFDLVYLPNSRVPFTLVCLSRRFEEWPTYSPGPESTWMERRYPEDGAVLPASLDTLDSDLDRWAPPQEPPKASPKG